jgi:hypothetical protein
MYGCLAGLYLHAHVLLLNRTPQEPRAALRTIQPLQPEKKACRAGPGPGRAGAGRIEITGVEDAVKLAVFS